MRIVVPSSNTYDELIDGCFGQKLIEKLGKRTHSKGWFHKMFGWYWHLKRELILTGHMIVCRF
jgi:hypothetical protein